MAIFPKLCLWRRTLYSNLGDIGPEKLYRATLNEACTSYAQFNSGLVARAKRPPAEHHG